MNTKVVGLHSFDDREKDQAQEMAKFFRGRAPFLADYIEAGRRWKRDGIGEAWEYLRDSVQIEEEEGQ